MEKEIWKDISGYEGLYQVSNLGKVRSLERIAKAKGNSYRKIPAKEIAITYGTNGYLHASLWKNNKMKFIPIHRLIAEAFIPNPQSKPCIDHINTNRTDNRIENLRWCTYQENNNNPITKDKMNKSRKIA